MTFQTSDFSGDDLHNILCTGDVCTGDRVAFERATFSGSFPNAKFAGFERIVAEVIADSDGRDKQQHTFTLRLADGSKMLIKGQNLYANGTWRQRWQDESLRDAALDKKHSRCDLARSARDERKAYSPWLYRS